jgi:hypothetical protein
LIRRFTFFVFIFVLTESTHAQFKFSYSGYLVDLPVFQSSREIFPELSGANRNQFLNLTRARLRSSLDTWKNGRSDIEYEIDGLYFHSLNGVEFSSAVNTNRQIVNLRWEPVNEKHYIVTHYIDRLSFRQDFKKFNVVIGRQRISWGTGRIWNPTDLFNPINPASYYKIEKDGADAISLKYAFANFTDLNMVYNPQRKIRNSNYGFRFRTNHWEYDMSVMGGFFDRRIVGGMDFAGNLFDAGVRGEGIYSVNKDKTGDHYVKFILGIDNQFTSDLYALLEYYYNGEGRTDKLQYDLAGLESGSILNLSRNYVCVSSVYQLNPLLNITLTDITNLNDGSGFINLIGSYSAKEFLTLGLGLQMTYGTENSEYWYYPFSLYFQAQYYF